jgi:hypothetical protein
LLRIGYVMRLANPLSKGATPLRSGGVSAKSVAGIDAGRARVREAKFMDAPGNEASRITIVAAVPIQ